MSSRIGSLHAQIRFSTASDADRPTVFWQHHHEDQNQAKQKS